MSKKDINYVYVRGVPGRFEARTMLPVNGHVILDNEFGWNGDEREVNARFDPRSKPGWDELEMRQTECTLCNNYAGSCLDNDGFFTVRCEGPYRLDLVKIKPNSNAKGGAFSLAEPFCPKNLLNR